MADFSANTRNLQSALISLKVVRHSFGNFLKSLAAEAAIPNSEENEIPNKKLFSTFKSNLRDLEGYILSLTPSTSSSDSFSNIEVLSLDPTPEKLNLYHQLMDCYTWIEKVSTYSGMVYSICNGNHLKRSNIHKRKRLQPTLYDANVNPQIVEMHIQKIKDNKSFPEMTLKVVRPLRSNAILQVTLGRVLKAVITFRGLLIEGVVVRAYTESHTDEDGRVELYRPSQFNVFQKVSDNATAAMLYFFTPGAVEVSILSFFTWLNSYSNLFTEVCKKCNNHIRHNFPPTWREFRSLLAYHEECKP